MAHEFLIEQTCPYWKAKCPICAWIWIECSDYSCNHCIQPLDCIEIRSNAWAPYIVANPGVIKWFKIDPSLIAATVKGEDPNPFVHI